MNREISTGKYITNKFIFLNIKNSFGKNAIFWFGNSRELFYRNTKSHMKMIIYQEGKLLS